MGEFVHSYKTILRGDEVKEKIKKGVNDLANLVKSTLGPFGKNVILERRNEYGERRGDSLITNDGVTIARFYIAEDATEDLAAQVVIDAAKNTSEQVGDGTTTCVTLVQAILAEARKKMTNTKSVFTGIMSIKREIQESCKKVVEELKKMAKPVEKKEDLERVTIVALENQELGKMVADMVWEIGKNGWIGVEEGFLHETEKEVVQGMKIDASFVSDLLITNYEKREAVWDSTPILVTNIRIESREDFNYIVKDLVHTKMKKENLVIIAENFDKTIVPWIVGTTHHPKGLKVLGIKTPALEPDQMRDVACYVGATFFDRDQGMELDKLIPDDFGEADKVAVDADFAVIVGGKGKKEEIEERVEKLKQERDAEKTLMFKKKIERRIASLSSGIGQIRVGALTQTEKRYLKKKIENAVNSAKASLEEGVIKGGGLALEGIAEKMPSNILTEALKAPRRQIQENAEEEFEIGENILDPAKVVRVALENAVEVASNLLTVEGSLADKRMGLEEIKELMGFTS